MIEKVKLWDDFLEELNEFRSKKINVKKFVWNIRSVAMPYWILVYIDRHPKFKIELYRKQCFIILKDKKGGVTWTIDKMMRDFFKKNSYRQPRFMFRDFKSEQ